MICCLISYYLKAGDHNFYSVTSLSSSIVIDCRTVYCLCLPHLRTAGNLIVKEYFSLCGYKINVMHFMHHITVVVNRIIGVCRLAIATSSDNYNNQ